MDIEQKNLRVIFTQEADLALVDILKENDLQESDEEFFNKLENNQEPKETITRGAVATIARKTIPDEKTIELLTKHLDISHEKAEKIVYDIKEKLLPLLKIYPDEKFDDYNFREKVSEEIFGSENTVIEYEKEDFQKELLNKIKGGAAEIASSRLSDAPRNDEQEEIPEPNIKNVPVADVDKNAEEIKTQRQGVGPQRPASAPNPAPKNPLITTIEEEMEKIDQAQPTEVVPQKQPDSYRESVE